MIPDSATAISSSRTTYARTRQQVIRHADNRRFLLRERECPVA
jgi:hypothetical protein